MTAPDSLPPELEALALGAMEREVRKRKDALRAQLNQTLTEGQSQQIRSPHGDVLGRVGKTDPEPSWQITNQAALDDYLRGFDGVMQSAWVIADEVEAVEHLRVCAPHLVREIRMVDPDARTAALEQSKATGEPAAPGIARVKPAGVVSVTPAKDALAGVGRMVAAGQLTWDARPALAAPTDLEEKAS